jgi:chromosome partitioning protein
MPKLRYAIVKETSLLEENFFMFPRKDLEVAHIYTIANNKGGCTKTTCVVQLGYELARRSMKVLIIDTDSQCNASYSLSRTIITSQAESSLFDVIIGVRGDQSCRRKLEDIIIPIEQQKGLYLAPGSTELANSDVYLASSPGREAILRRAIAPIVNNYDVILIDTPPTLGLIPVMAFVAAGTKDDFTNGLVIPITPQAYSVLGIGRLEQVIEVLRTNLELPVPIFGVICSRVQRTKNAVDRINEVEEYFGSLVFTTRVPVSEKVEEAADMQMSLFEYRRRNPGAIAFAKLANEFGYRAGLFSQQECIVYLQDQGWWNKEQEELWRC